MPKASAELIARRKKEIIDACENIYKVKGFYGVTIKEISTRTNFTRPSIYNYFSTKDEILLALLVREYEKLTQDLKLIQVQASSLTRQKLSECIAHALEKRAILLRIQNMNLFEIEENSRIEHLAELKKAYRRNMATMMGILRSYNPSVSDADYDSCCMTFSAFLFGVYSFAFHTEKQLKAMEIAGFPDHKTTIYQMVYDCLVRLLPDK